MVKGGIATDILKEQFIPDHIFIYVVKGSLRIFDGNKRYIFKWGDAFLLRKNTLVKFELLEDIFEPVAFCFEESFLKEFQQKHSLIYDPNSGIVDALIEIKTNTIINSFMESIKPYHKGFMELQKGFEDLKYNELLLILLLERPDLSDILFDFAAPAKIDLMAFMNKNYKFNIGILDFAKLTGRSLSSFKRDFKNLFNATPGRWLTKKRLEEAYFLINTKHQKPVDIYLDLGFESLSHFSVAFKKEFNLTPTKLINEIRG
ncbi:helix-turn-helix domain-containing protein [Epilithonimonas caeni]|uniref:helix-turn-helix domain-containing protein n=1 Tax=Epilithonimonas caeni TaxID=365343 RepID=UPI00040FBCC8|nr:AraC family transcriptional regulator [Epilithonimonas caeni]